VSAPLLQVDGLKVHYPLPRRSWFAERQSVKAVDDVSFELYPGEALGVVGETGCGKSSLGRAILQLVAPTAGQVVWLGRSLADLPRAELAALRGELQLIFQDPLSSLNPRMTIGDLIGEPLQLHHKDLSRHQVLQHVQEMMARVGLMPEMISRYPGEFSGGQCQRISIARAMILRPKLLVCDEPVSALDVSIQAQVLNLLKALQAEMGVALIFISHDLAVVHYMCQRVLVMYLGRIMEVADRQRLFRAPLHPYTQALLSAVPEPDPRRQRGKAVVELEGDLPSPINPPTGCVFHTRCSKAVPVCVSQRPTLERASGEHQVACHRWRDT
jgi:oligopeptide transport system ATP-binding protein